MDEQERRVLCVAYQDDRYTKKRRQFSDELVKYKPTYGYYSTAARRLDCGNTEIDCM